MNKEKIALIGTVGVPGRYGGFETLAHQLVVNLNKDYDLTVYCSKPHYADKNQHPFWSGARRIFLPLKANGAQSIAYDMLSMLHAIRRNDLLMIFGVSGALLIPFIKLFSKTKIILHIDGLEWKRPKWGKMAKAFLKFSEKIGIQFSDAHISDNKGIADYVAEEYQAISEVIEYGGNHAKPQAPEVLHHAKYEFLKRDYAFSVCRIEPENNLHLILQAFSELDRPDLVIVGNWNDSGYGKNLRSIFSNQPNIHLLDPIYDQKELDVLRSNCSVYLHGHSAGGTNPSLVEAMWLELPVIAFDVVFNRETTRNSAIFFKHAGELSLILKNYSPDQFQRVAKRLKEVANARYTWNWIARKYFDLFEKVSDKASSLKTSDIPMITQRAA